MEGKLFLPESRCVVTDRIGLHKLSNSANGGQSIGGDRKIPMREIRDNMAPAEDERPVLGNIVRRCLAVVPPEPRLYPSLFGVGAA